MKDEKTAWKHAQKDKRKRKKMKERMQNGIEIQSAAVDSTENSVHRKENWPQLMLRIISRPSSQVSPLWGWQQQAYQQLTCRKQEKEDEEETREHLKEKNRGLGEVFYARTLCPTTYPCWWRPIFAQIAPLPPPPPQSCPELIDFRIKFHYEREPDCDVLIDLDPGLCLI